MENHMIPPAVFLEEPELIGVHLFADASKVPIILRVDGDCKHDTVIRLHMTPECAVKIAKELLAHTTDHGVCKGCGCYRPLSGDIHCITCDKELGRTHDAEMRG